MQPLHSWLLSSDEAVKVQAKLRAQLSLSWDNRAIETIGGVDVDLEENVARAALALLHKWDYGSGARRSGWRHRGCMGGLILSGQGAAIELNCMTNTNLRA